MEYELWFARRLRRSVRGSDQLDRQSARIHRPKRRARRPRRTFQRCAALRHGWSGPGSLRSSCATIEAPPGGVIEVIFLLGEAESEEAARSLVKRYRAADLDAVEMEVERRWDDILGSVVVKTPDRSMDLMLNGWLLYQTLSCRVWARSGFYQASGAYGFRDQLQDGMALTRRNPR